ncbi:MAG: hypothetical protein ACLFT0_06485 [Spirulinaceae cyanobacterium]
MARIQLHFNGNFAFKKEDICKILKVANEKKGLKDNLQNLMNRTSLGNAKIGRIKSWAIRSGLVNQYHLSPEGKIAWNIDRFLESNITDWLIHFYLSFSDKGLKQTPVEPADWGGWTYFVYTFLPQYPTFTSNELLQHSDSIFEETSKVIATRFNYILRTYTEQQALASCHFLIFVLNLSNIWKD